jgi:hypothetical protein
VRNTLYSWKITCILEILQIPDVLADVENHQRPQLWLREPREQDVCGVGESVMLEEEESQNDDHFEIIFENRKYKEHSFRQYLGCQV